MSSEGAVAFVTGNEAWRKINFETRTENRYTLHPQGLRRCLKCREIRAIGDFHIKGSKGQRNSSCKSCENARHAVHRAAMKREPETYCRVLLPQLRHRAKVQAVAFNLTADDLFQRWITQGGACYYTGKPLNLAAHTASRNSPHVDFASLDRLVPARGYVRGNIAWCAWAVNRAKSDLDESSFIAMCKTIASRR